MIEDESTGGIHILVSGRVQGVGFRQMVRQSALAAGVGGWVRNLRDGRVEAVLTGPPEAVQRGPGRHRTRPRRRAGGRGDHTAGADGGMGNGTDAGGDSSHSLSSSRRPLLSLHVLRPSDD